MQALTAEFFRFAEEFSCFLQREGFKHSLLRFILLSQAFNSRAAAVRELSSPQDLRLIFAG
jgi:hypothetical protein